MINRKKLSFLGIVALLSSPCASLVYGASAPDRLVGIHSARVMSQSFPWIAQEAGLFKKYNLDFNLVFVASSSIVTAALLGGDADMTVTGGIGNVIAYLRGSTDVVFTGGIKNTMTQTLVAGGNIKKPEDLKGKKIRREPDRRQLPLFYDSSPAPLQYGTQSRLYVYSDRR